MLDIEKYESEVKVLSVDKPIDELYVDRLLEDRLKGEDYPSLRVRDEVQAYHRGKWTKDCELFRRKIERVKDAITSEREKKEGEYQDAETRMAKILKYIPDPDTPELPWDWVSKVEAWFCACCLVAIIAISTYNIPTLLMNSIPDFYLNPYMAKLLVFSISLAAICVKLAENKFDIFARVEERMVRFTANNILWFALLTVTSFLIVSYDMFSPLTVKSFAAQFNESYKRYAQASSVLFIFIMEISATMLFTKVLYRIVKTHGKKDKLNPEYSVLREKIDSYLDIIKSERTAAIILASMEELLENGMNTYAQRADAYLVQRASAKQRGNS